MRQIEKIDLNIGQAYLSEWNESMAIRELIESNIIAIIMKGRTQKVRLKS